MFTDCSDNQYEYEGSYSHNIPHGNSVVYYKGANQAYIGELMGGRLDGYRTLFDVFRRKKYNDFGKIINMMGME